jgi:hypothetical protein
MVSRNCSASPLMQMTNACPRWHAALGAQLRMLKAQILEFDRMIMVWHRSSEASRRLDDIPGVGKSFAWLLNSG